MRTAIKLLIFFLCNVAGFYVGPLLFAIVLNKRLIDIQNSQLTMNTLESSMGIILIAWLACALFSFASFFLKGPWRIVFLTMPIIVPTIFTIMIIRSYM